MASKKKSVVLVRTYSAGVHFGQLVSRKGREVTLANARRIWSWSGANTLHEIVLRGCAVGSKISESVASITLLDAIEVIPIQPAAIGALAKIGWGK